MMLERAEDLLRSLVFYAVFYGGTVPYLLAALLSLAFGANALQAMATYWSRYHRACVRHILGIRVNVEGELPGDGVLIAVRHESFFEAIDLPALLSRPAIFAKVELLRIPLWGRLARAYGLIAVDREQGARALRKMLTAARACCAEGRVLAIFPEGTRIAHGCEGTIQSGFAGLYKLLGQPVVPVAVNSGPLYHRWWKHKGTITYRIGPTIPAGLPRAAIEERVRTAINALNET